MSVATLTGKQVGKIIELLENTSSDQVQRMLASGLFTDLRDADFAGVTPKVRAKIRRLLGLQPLVRRTPSRNALSWSAGFRIPTCSKRGPLWPKSKGNQGNVENPSQGYLMPEVDLTPPDKAVEALQGMFSGLDITNWEQALKIGVEPAIKACETLKLDPARLIVSPWIKRSALARFMQEKAKTFPHYGALIEQVVFSRLARVYKGKGLGFNNLRAGKMSADNYLMMTDETAAWLKAREEEIEGDVCFSAMILDLFHGFSVNATRFELERVKQMVGGTSYVVQQSLLTQPQLLAAYNHQRWDMPGDKYDYEGQSRFPSAPFCDVYDFAFGFGDAYAGHADSDDGSVVFLVEVLCD